jgi:hypothetical protein
MKRKSGYYRVQYGYYWIVAQYFKDYDIWHLIGLSLEKKDKDFEQIDEEIIVFKEIKNNEKLDRFRKR